MSIYNKILDKILDGEATFADQEKALKHPKTAIYFACYVPGANIEKCQEAACKDPMFAYWFANRIPGADILKCIEVCKGTKWESMLNELLMDKALI